MTERRRATQLAWAWWLVLLAAPLVVLVAGHAAVGPLEPVEWSVGTILVSTVGVIWLLSAVPAAVALRSHCFRAGWHGRPLDAASYLRGMRTVWGVLAAGALWSVLGTVITGAWLPAVLPAVVAMMALALLWPNSRAMTG